MKFHLNTLAAAAVALTAAPSFAQDDLSPELVEQFERMAALIKEPEEGKEGRLVQAYDILDKGVMGDMKNFLMVVLNLYRHGASSEPSAEDSKPRKNSGVARDPETGEVPFANWDDDEKGRFPTDNNGDPDPAYILLRFSPGSTEVCKYLSTGKVCWTRD